MTIEIVGIDVKRQYENMRSMSGEMFVAISTQKVSILADRVSETLVKAIEKNGAVFSTLNQMEKTEYEREIHRLTEANTALRESERKLTDRLDTIKKCLGCTDDDDWDDDYE